MKSAELEGCSAIDDGSVGTIGTIIFGDLIALWRQIPVLHHSRH